MTNEQQFAVPAQRPAIGDQYVAFRVGAQPYALPIATVREIVRPPEIASVPQSPDYVAGVMNLRGRIIPVIDLRKLFHANIAAQSPAPKARILVLTREGKLIGMLVDSASEVVKIDPAQIEPSPKLFGDSAETYVTGVAKHQCGLLVLLDANRLLPQMDRPDAAGAPHLPGSGKCGLEPLRS